MKRIGDGRLRRREVENRLTLELHRHVLKEGIEIRLTKLGISILL
jgi:hypothetical protein